MIAFASVAVAGTLGLAACQPPPPPATFTVDSLANGADANPGNGVCATANTPAVCTVRAAIQEANALGKGIVVVPRPAATAWYPAVTTTITGSVTIRGSLDPADGYPVPFDSGSLTISPGGSLTLDSVIFSPTTGSSPWQAIEVQGALVGSRFRTAGTITVRPGGAALLVNSSVSAVGPAATALDNEGSVTTRFTNLTAGGGPAFSTHGAGRTDVGASLGFSINGPATCSGTPPVSAGYNHIGLGNGGGTFDPACGLTGATDVVTSFPWPPIPVGTLGCGTTVTGDGFGRPRPDPVDGTCTAGMRE